MPVSNPGCPVCASPLRAKIDAVLLKRWQKDMWVIEVDGLVNEQLSKVSTVTAAGKKRAAALRQLLSLEPHVIGAHDTMHRCVSPRQRYTQPKFMDGDIFEGIDLSQALPHTQIGAGISGLVFKRCALENCDVPEDAKLVDCTNGHKSYCSHLNPNLLRQKLIPQCASDCEHAVSYKKRLVMDGVVVAKDIRHYRNKPVD